MKHEKELHSVNVVIFAGGKFAKIFREEDSIAENAKIPPPPPPKKKISVFTVL